MIPPQDFSVFRTKLIISGDDVVDLFFFDKNHCLQFLYGLAGGENLEKSLFALLVGLCGRQHQQKTPFAVFVRPCGWQQ